ncbi:hypothetical protein, partial [Thermogutta sp.]|uniref:hypothetical protein n=1 Tax=Thermogutta sp. TaxID=1962930 RepID=UPI0032202807
LFHGAVYLRDLATISEKPHLSHTTAVTTRPRCLAQYLLYSSSLWLRLAHAGPCHLPSVPDVFELGQPQLRTPSPRSRKSDGHHAKCHVMCF